jgi:hypothetical protein
MRTTTSRPQRHHRPNSPSIDPYVVQGTTWTREEILRARGLPARSARRRTTGPHRKAA